MSRLYAEQLMTEGEVRKAVSYALMAGQTSRAVEMFASHQLHRESVALTRCLHPDESAQVRESLSLWSSKAIQDGNLELATKCLLANGDVAEAARVLARRSDPASLKISADLASNAGLNQLSEAYLHQAAEISNNAAATAEQPSTPTPVIAEDESSLPASVLLTPPLVEDVNGCDTNDVHGD